MFKNRAVRVTCSDADWELMKEYCEYLGLPMAVKFKSTILVEAKKWDRKRS
uniref:Uncharacterized protein n=1 Tax=uncultured marine virus TaxID=186617 RepID=A0A0F7L0H5_9VIRU|nr:hypothetical protein [uncultured marine virus]